MVGVFVQVVCKNYVIEHFYFFFLQKACKAHIALSTCKILNDRVIYIFIVLCYKCKFNVSKVVHSKFT